MRISRTRLGHPKSVVVRGHDDAETVCMQTSSLEDISSICIFCLRHFQEREAFRAAVIILVFLWYLLACHTVRFLSDQFSFSDRGTTVLFCRGATARVSNASSNLSFCDQHRFSDVQVTVLGDNC